MFLPLYLERYGAWRKESFDVLYRDGQYNSRVLVLHLHPWVIGQPFRIGVLDQAPGYRWRHQGVRVASGA